MVNEKNYITIQGWMIKELGLKGNKLLTYALIYGFTQDGKSEFNGSLTYIADWVGVTKRAVIDILNDLIAKQLITKVEHTAGNIKVYSYKVTSAENFTTGEKTSPGGEKTSPPNNNNIYNNTKNSFINKTIKKLSLFADYEYLFDALEQWLQYKHTRRQSYKSDKSILIFCKHLHELSGGNADIAMQIVEQSMANNWSGIFPLKNQSFASNITEDELNSFVDMWNNMANHLAPRGEFINGNKVRSIVADDVRIMLPDAKRNLLCVINEIKNWGKLPLAINVPLDENNYWNWALTVVANRLLRSSYLRGQTPNAPMFTFDVKFFCYNIKKLANPYDECFLDR